MGGWGLPSIVVLYLLLLPVMAYCYTVSLLNLLWKKWNLGKPGSGNLSKFSEVNHIIQIYIEQISKYFLKDSRPVKLPADYGFCLGNHVYPFYIYLVSMWVACMILTFALFTSFRTMWLRFSVGSIKTLFAFLSSSEGVMPN